jgi:hypothetical protein
VALHGILGKCEENYSGAPHIPITQSSPHTDHTELPTYTPWSSSHTLGLFCTSTWVATLYARSDLVIPQPGDNVIPRLVNIIQTVKGWDAKDPLIYSRRPASLRLDVI